MQKDSVYLDFNATTPLSKDVLQKMPELLQFWGNPSSIHLASRPPKTILRETRKKLADYLKCSPLELVFNSGASEGNNTVLKSVWAHYRPGNHFQNTPKNEFIISSVEHPSVMKTAEHLKSEGAIIHYIPVNKNGVMNIEFIRSKVNANTALISCMFANNETGSVFPIREIAELAKKHHVLMHSDCVQAFGKKDFDLQTYDVDYITLSAHKFYALKGCGVLYVKKGAPFLNLVHGGGQERSRRGGTENILGVASMEVMLNYVSQISIKEKEIKILRDFLESEILKMIPDAEITAVESERLANTSSLVIPGIDGETLLVSLDLKGFAVSTGAACSSGNPEPSPVLLAMGLTSQQAQNSLRISLGWTTTQDHIDLFLSALKDIVTRLKKINETETSQHASTK